MENVDSFVVDVKTGLNITPFPVGASRMSWPIDSMARMVGRDVVARILGLDQYGEVPRSKQRREEVSGLWASETADAWYKKHRSWIKCSAEYASKQKRIAEAVLPHVRGKVADMGCGTAAIAAYIGHGYKLGVDWSAEACKFARRRMPSVEFSGEDIERSTMIEQAPYDTVLFLDVLQCVEDDVGMLRRVPTGRRVIFSVTDNGGQGRGRTFRDHDRILSRYGKAVQIRGWEKLVIGEERWWVLHGDAVGHSR
jgi:SAM-dependent methyltransferase